MSQPATHTVLRARGKNDLAPLLRLDTAVESVEFNFTNHCNLRCVYCPQGTHEEGFHAETSRQQLDQIITYIKNNRVQRASVGYYGETTLVEGWEEVCQTLLDLGVRMTMVSNFARVLTPREVEVLAQFEEIQVSIDIVDQQILRSVRKSVDVRSIIYNSQLIQAHAILHRIQMPRVIWTGVLTDQVVMGLSHLVATAAVCNIRSINFNSLGYFDGARDSATHVCDMPDTEFLRAAEEIERALALAKQQGIFLRFQNHRQIMRRVVELTGKSRVLDNGHYLANLDDLSSRDRIFIYGSGAPGRYVAREIKKRGSFDFQGFLDSSWSGEVDQSPVQRFDAYLERRRDDDLILVCAEAYDQIEVNLQQAKVNRYLDAREIYLHSAGQSRGRGNARIKRQGIQGCFETTGDRGDDLAEGLTRLCDSAWMQVYTDPKGEVYSCCQRGDSMGNLGTDIGLSEILNGDAYRELRRQLLTGRNLSTECSRCVAKPPASPEKMQNWIREKLARRETLR